ncbi:MAG: hypothetical protein K6A14_08785 [Erysipelotrichaceae bacterium]|nr:hypothetical protein [Erysipelotrichaceae bacterium]
MIFVLIIMYVMLRSMRFRGFYGYRGPRFYHRPMIFSPFMFGPRPPMGFRGPGRAPGMGHHSRGPFGM